MCLASAAECDDGNEVAWDGCTQGHAGERLVSPVPGECHDGGAVVAVDNGFLVFWLALVGGGSGGTKLEAISLAPDGKPVGEKWTVVPSFLDGGEGGKVGFVDAERLTDGRILLAYRGALGSDVVAATNFVWLEPGEEGADKQVAVSQWWAEETAPSLARVADGGFDFAWAGSGSTDDSGAGVAYLRATEDPVMAQTTVLTSVEDGGYLCIPGRPDVAVSPQNGNTLVVWATADPTVCPAYGILESGYPRIEGVVTNSGAPNAHPPEQLNQNQVAAQTDVAVVPPAGDDFVALWVGGVQLETGVTWGIVGRYVAADGQPTGDDFLVSSPSGAGYYSNVRGASIYQKSWGAVWNLRAWEGFPTDYLTDVYIRLYGKDGTPGAEPVRANVFMPGPQKVVGLAAGAGGNSYMVAWCSCGNAPNGGCGIFVRSFQAAQ